MTANETLLLQLVGNRVILWHKKSPNTAHRRALLGTLEEGEQNTFRLRTLKKVYPIHPDNVEIDVKRKMVTEV